MSARFRHAVLLSPGSSPQVNTVYHWLAEHGGLYALKLYTKWPPLRKSQVCARGTVSFPAAWKELCGTPWEEPVPKGDSCLWLHLSLLLECWEDPLRATSGHSSSPIFNFALSVIKLRFCLHLSGSFVLVFNCYTSQSREEVGRDVFDDHPPRPSERVWRPCSGLYLGPPQSAPSTGATTGPAGSLVSSSEVWGLCGLELDFLEIPTSPDGASSGTNSSTLEMRT